MEIKGNENLMVDNIPVINLPVFPQDIIFDVKPYFFDRLSVFVVYFIRVAENC